MREEDKTARLMLSFVFMASLQGIRYATETI